MKCKCGKEMRGVGCWDDAQLTDHAFNLYLCEGCGMICKEDVWEHKGLRWLQLDGTFQYESTPHMYTAKAVDLQTIDQHDSRSRVYPKKKRTSDRKIRIAIGNATRTHCQKCPWRTASGGGMIQECSLFQYYARAPRTLKTDEKGALRDEKCLKAEKAYEKSQVRSSGVS